MRFHSCSERGIEEVIAASRFGPASVISSAPCKPYAQRAAFVARELFSGVRMSNIRSLIAITFMVTAFLILPSCAPAGVHHKFISSRSALPDAGSIYLLPPRNEPPPPPPPHEDPLIISISFNSAAHPEGSPNVQRFEVEAQYCEYSSCLAYLASQQSNRDSKSRISNRDPLTM
jgi:hypothetical protein